MESNSRDSFFRSSTDSNVDQASHAVDHDPVCVLADSRRSWLKGAAASLVGLAALSNEGLAGAQTTQPTGTPLAAKVPFFDVRDFGALGNGTANDTSAVQAAFNFVQGLTRGIVYFPAGTYRLLSPVGCSNCNIAVLGAGRGVSVLQCEGSGGLSFAFTSWAYRLTIQALTLKTSLVGGGTGIYVTYPSPPFVGAGNDPAGHIDDVEIGPNVEDVHYWNKGIEILNGTGFKISRFHIAGKTGGRSSMSHGIRLENCSISWIESGNVYSADLGIYSGQAEGTYISMVEVVDANSGIYLYSGGGVTISNCHTNTLTAGIVLVEHHASSVHGNVLYRLEAVNYIGIRLTNADKNVVSGNQMYLITSGAAKNGIFLEGTSRNCTITGNISENFDTGVWLTSASVATNVVANNRAISPGAAGVLDWGTGNLVVNNL